MSLYNTPYYDPNKITFKVKSIIAGEDDFVYDIYRYDWDNGTNTSPYYTEIEEYFGDFDNRIKETVDIYTQWRLLTDYAYFTDSYVYSQENPTMSGWIIKDLLEKVHDKVERIKLVGHEKYFNPVTHYIEYKLEDGTFVETDEKVKSKKRKIDIKDILEIIDSKEFIRDCMPVENRNRKIDSILND